MKSGMTDERTLRGGVVTMMAISLCAAGVVYGVAGCERPPASGSAGEGAPLAQTQTQTQSQTQSQTQTQTSGSKDDGEEGRVAPATLELVAVGDVHGDIAPLRSILLRAALIDAADHWVGGDRTLVQTGDILDRGDDEKEAYELLWRLQTEAEAAGGRVVLLNGNHEVMNVMGDMRYVTPGGADDFAGLELPDDPRYDRVPPRLEGRLAAFLPGGPWAKRLAGQPVIARVGAGLFAHGGVHMEHVEFGIERINQEMKKWMLEGGTPPRWATDQDGPLWTRAWSSPQPVDCARLATVLEAAGAEFLAVGHTPQKGGVTRRCDGKLWLIDTGMASHYGGVPGAIGIRPDGAVVSFEAR